MGVSTDGQICFGIVFPEGFEFPWDDPKFDGEIEEWWRSIHGYKEPFKLYDGGEYVGGVKPSREKIDEWYEHHHAWDENHPVPIEIVNYCSGDCPMYILAVRDTIREAARGYPSEIEPTQMLVEDEKLIAFNSFIENHIKRLIHKWNSDEYNEDDQIMGNPRWYLSSYWSY